MTNEYIRIEKRIWVIEHIYDLPIDILSDDFGNDIKNSNASFLPTIAYEKLSKFINEYSFAVNVDPNYHACIHDRFIKTISSGTVCVTNRNNLTEQITPYTYMFNDENSVMNALNSVGNKSANMFLRTAILQYSWEKSAKIILDDFEGQK